MPSPLRAAVSLALLTLAPGCFDFDGARRAYCEKPQNANESDCVALIGFDSGFVPPPPVTTDGGTSDGGQLDGGDPRDGGTNDAGTMDGGSGDGGSSIQTLQIGGTGNAEVRDARAHAGRVLVSGTFTGNGTLSGQAASATNKLVFTSYEPPGSAPRAELMGPGNASEQQHWDVASTSTDEVVIAASHTGIASCGGASFTGQANLPNGFVVRVAQDGSCQGLASGQSVVVPVVATYDQRVYVAGSSFGQASQFAGHVFPPTGTASLLPFVMALDFDGNRKWVQPPNLTPLGAQCDGYPLDAVVDSQGRLFVAIAVRAGNCHVGNEATTQSPILLSRTMPNTEDLYVVAYDDSGVVAVSQSQPIASMEGLARLQVMAGMPETLLLTSQVDIPTNPYLALTVLNTQDLSVQQLLNWPGAMGVRGISTEANSKVWLAGTFRPGLTVSPCNGFNAPLNQTVPVGFVARVDGIGHCDHLLTVNGSNFGGTRLHSVTRDGSKLVLGGNADGPATFQDGQVARGGFVLSFPEPK